MLEATYTAVIGDLVASRAAPDRTEVQRVLVEVLAEVSAELGPDLLARPFLVTAGDEFQALAFPGPGVLEALVAITERFQAQALEVAFGLGHGTLSTDPERAPVGAAASPALLDGPCFHHARAALQQAKARHTWAVCAGFGSPYDEGLGGLFELMGAVRAGWTGLQGSHVRDLRALGVQRRVAEKWGVNPSVISESVKAARYEALRRGEEGARALLSAFVTERPTS